MKLTSVLTTTLLLGMMTLNPVKDINPLLSQVSAEEMKDVTGLTSEAKIESIAKNKGQFGSGDQLRRFYFGDLEPISVQPGGAGMVVNLYNKANNVTFAYCATYDVVVAIKQGKVKRFEPSEVK